MSADNPRFAKVVFLQRHHQHMTVSTPTDSVLQIYAKHDALRYRFDLHNFSGLAGQMDRAVTAVAEWEAERYSQRDAGMLNSPEGGSGYRGSRDKTARGLQLARG